MSTKNNFSEIKQSFMEKVTFSNRTGQCTEQEARVRSEPLILIIPLKRSLAEVLAASIREDLLLHRGHAKDDTENHNGDDGDDGKHNDQSDLIRLESTR